MHFGTQRLPFNSANVFKRPDSLANKIIIGQGFGKRKPAPSCQLISLLYLTPRGCRVSSGSDVDVPVLNFCPASGQKFVYLTGSRTHQQCDPRRLAGTYYPLSGLPGLHTPQPYSNNSGPGLALIGWKSGEPHLRILRQCTASSSNMGSVMYRLQLGNKISSAQREGKEPPDSSRLFFER